MENKTPEQQKSSGVLSAAILLALAVFAVWIFSLVPPTSAEAQVFDDAGVPSQAPEVLAVGAPYNDSSGSNAGRVDIYAHSNYTLPLQLVASETGASPNDLFGSAVAVGDFNNDGVRDLAVGAPQFDLGGIPFGRVYVYLGGYVGLAGTLSSPNSYANFGATLAAGDVNGDGFEDVVVGAPDDNTAAAQAGRVYVFLGGSGTTFNTTSDAVINGAQAYEHFGLTLATRADIDGDGYDDLAVGAPYADVTLFSTIVDAGRVYIYRGASTFPGTGGWTIFGVVANDNYGRGLALARKLNGDTYGDLIVGVPNKDVSGNTNIGRAYVYFGPSPGTVVGTLTGAAAGDLFGWAVTTADMNLDGFEDVVVSAPENDAAGSNAGAVYVFFGASGSTFNNVADAQVNGPGATSKFGFSLANATKLNPPTTFIVGAYAWSAGSGRAYVYSAQVAGWLEGTLAGPANGDFFGWSVSGH